MGVENNEAVLAITSNREAATELAKWIQEQVAKEYRPLFVFIHAVVNGKVTLVMAPDGSKKNWETADDCALIRQRLIDKLRSLKNEYGSEACEWVEVGWGEYGQKVLQGNNQNRHNNNKEYAD